MLKPWTGRTGTRVRALEARASGGAHPCAQLAVRGRQRRISRGAALVFLLSMVLWTGSFAGMASAQTAPGTTIDNQALGTYRNGVGTDVLVPSNLDQITVAVSRTPSTLEFLKYGLGVPGSVLTPVGPNSCSQSGTPAGPFVPSPGMFDLSGAPINLAAPVPLISDGAYKAGEPVFLRLIDLDQNLDPLVAETALVTLESDGGDRETLRLTENGPNTGIFIGYIMSATPPPVSGDCQISVDVGETIRADYTDIVDGSDASSDVTLVDPFGIVFDSTTGAPIDGAVVTLWDVLAGAPASVVGDDGFETFPSTITSGGSTVDSGGQVYNFAPGRYRFPFVSPGQYELRIVPPATHNHPSVAPDGQIQSLPGAPFALVPGSRGGAFSVPVGPAVRVDIPLDPVAGDLLVTKQAGKNRVGEGEFVPYRVRVTNSSGGVQAGTTLFDQLPPRFRFESGSARVRGVQAPDPVIAENGREMQFPLGDLAPGESVEVQYVARVAPGAKPGEYINRAFAETALAIRSNIAEAVVEVQPDLFDDRSYLLGRIHIDGCDPELDEPAEGLGGVRVYLEDGSFVVTDEEGRYHFEAISAGLHVVQLDLDSIPEAYEPVECEQDQRKAGRSFSEFVEVRPGTLWRSDFHVQRKVPEDGILAQRLTANASAERVEYRLELSADRVDADGVTAMVRLPEALRFETGSARMGERALGAAAEDGTLVLRAGRLAAGQNVTIEFAARVVADGAQAAAAGGSGLIETQSVVRARPPTGKAVMTPPITVRFPLPAPPSPASSESAEVPAAPSPAAMSGDSPEETETPAADTPDALSPAEEVESILAHRLLHVERKGLHHYVMQVFVEEQLPEVILAEVDLPAHQRFLDWTPRNEKGDRVTTTRQGGRIRFVLPRVSSKDAVRIFLVGGVPQHVLQIFFTAEPNGAGESLATSRILPSFTRPAAPASGGAIRPTGGGASKKGRDLRAKEEARRRAAAKQQKQRTRESLIRGGGAGGIGEPRGAAASGADAAAGGAGRSAKASPSDSLARVGPEFVRRTATSQVKIAAADEASTGAAPGRAGPGAGTGAGAGGGSSAGGAAGEDDAARATGTAGQEAAQQPEERFGAAWLATAAPGNAFVYPEEGALPRIPSLKLGVQHDPALRVELLRNGEPVSPLNFDGRPQNADRTVALSRWRGVELAEGENLFVAVFRNQAGEEVGRANRTIHLAGSPVRAVLVPELSSLVADGRTSPVIALRLFDRFGEPVREGSTGQFDLDPPYQTQEEVDAARTQPLAELGFERPSFVVEEGGVARIRLHPTSVVGEARMRFQFLEGRETEMTAWLEPGDRDWVLVGLATGTVGWNDASGSEASRRADDAEEGIYTEGRVAFFAKGKVPGNYLLTAAYDTDASNTRLRNRLFQTLEPDEHYTLYGDTTQRDFDAPTSGRLFVKIEKRRFFALYGDYETGLEDTELSRYSRSLTGAKMEFRGDHFDAKAFLTDSDQSFVKDEILGDGTSGLYRLSREDIVPGSEQVYLEVRDRFRPEVVLSSEPQSRFADYEIDYRDGTLFFRQPIQGQDENFDPIFIVVDYETNDRRPNAITGGGRVAGRALEGRVEVGFTGIHEDGGEIDSQIFGGDTTIALSDQTELRGEFAHSRGDDFDGRRSDEAWLVELDHRGERLDLRAYAKEQGSDFGIGQQRGTEAALRSYGLDGGFNWTQTLRSQTSLFRQENLDNDAKRNVAELQTRWEAGRLGLNAGARYSGEDAAGKTGHAVQVLGGGRADFFDGRFSLRAEGEAAVAEDAFGDFPHRALVGADLKVHEQVTLFADQEMTFGNKQRTADTRAGIRGAPWKGATVSTSVAQETREFGPRTYANLGLQQRWDATQNWGFDLSIDRTATIRDPGNRPFNASAPAASGSFADDYTAVSLGTAYRTEGWSGTGRLETRFGENEDRWGLLAGFLRDANEDLSWSARVDLFSTNARSGAKELRSETSLSLAYRPLRSNWIVLERLDFDYRDNEGGDFEFESRRLLNHFKANQLFDRQTQIAYQLSNKLVVDTIENRQYTTFGTLVGLEIRKDFAEGWDMSMHGRLRHQTSGDEVSASYGLSVGRVLVDNVWLSLGYNLTGFYDEEFGEADYTAQGPYFRIRAKFDQLSVREALELFR